MVQTLEHFSQMYCFLSHVDPWSDIDNPPIPSQDQLSLKRLMKSIFVAKQVSTSDISPVVKRIDWTSEFIYDFYQDDVDMIATDINGNMIYTFYIRKNAKFSDGSPITASDVVFSYRRLVEYGCRVGTYIKINCIRHLE